VPPFFMGRKMSKQDSGGKGTVKKASGKTAVKRTGGRPSGYRPEYGDEIIALMEKGFSLTAAAAKIGFCRDTIYSWMEVHQEFSDSMRRARGLRQYFLEEKLLTTNNGAVVNAYKFALACACPDDWREKKEVDVHVSGSLSERLDAAKAAFAAGADLSDGE